MSRLPLSYDNPVTSVFLRILSWELYVAKRDLKVQDVVTEQVQIARNELGLEALEGGATHDFIQKMRKGSAHLSPKNTPPAPTEPAWKTEWRLLYLPSHSFVRQISENPVVTVLSQPQNHSEFQVTLRHPALPTLRIFVGAEDPKGNTFGKCRGVYFLRMADSLYIGKSDEFDIRLSQQIKNKHPLWWCFLSPEGSEQTFTQDALGAAESLLISFWNETSLINNQKRGGDQMPAFAYLQQAILLVEAASATLLWLIREKQDLGLPNWNIPFKNWKGINWPECYNKTHK